LGLGGCAWFVVGTDGAEGAGSADCSVSISKGDGAVGWGVWSGAGSRVLSKSNKPKGDIEKNLRFLLKFSSKNHEKQGIFDCFN
jgi:hypothetical protein